MAARWRRGCLLAIVACCLLFGGLGSLALVGLKTGRLRVAPPAKLLNLEPIWIGDFCRANVEHHLYPRHWCPRDYTVYLIIHTGVRRSMFPIFSIPDTPAEPLPRE